MAVGDRIKKLREEKQLTQEELAKSINSTKQTIYKYENNIITNIPSDKIESISNVLNVTPAYLMGWDVQNNSKYSNEYIESLERIKLIISKGMNEADLNKLKDTQSVEEFTTSMLSAFKEIGNSIENINMDSLDSFIKYVDSTFPEKEIRISLAELRILYDKVKNYTDITLNMILDKYKKTPEHLILKAAHEIEGASEEDKKHDYDLMNDDNF